MQLYGICKPGSTTLPKGHLREVRSLRGPGGWEWRQSAGWHWGTEKGCSPLQHQETQPQFPVRRWHEAVCVNHSAVPHNCGITVNHEHRHHARSLRLSHFWHTLREDRWHSHLTAWEGCVCMQRWKRLCSVLQRTQNIWLSSPRMMQATSLTIFILFWILPGDS